MRGNRAHVRYDKRRKKEAFPQHCRDTHAAIVMLADLVTPLFWLLGAHVARALAGTTKTSSSTTQPKHQPPPCPNLNPLKPDRRSELAQNESERAMPHILYYTMLEYESAPPESRAKPRAGSLQKGSNAAQALLFPPPTD